MWALVIKVKGNWKVRLIGNTNHPDYQQAEVTVCTGYDAGQIDDWRNVNLEYVDRNWLLDNTNVAMEKLINDSYHVML